MPLLVAVALYGGTYFGYVSYDDVVKPYLAKQAVIESIEFPVDTLGLQVEQENQTAFDNLK